MDKWIIDADGDYFNLRCVTQVYVAEYEHNYSFDKSYEQSKSDMSWRTYVALGDRAEGLPVTKRRLTEKEAREDMSTFVKLYIKGD